LKPGVADPMRQLRWTPSMANNPGMRAWAWADFLRRAQLGRRHVDAPGDQADRHAT
jgi:hypothetical protein